MDWSLLFWSFIGLVTLMFTVLFWPDITGQK